ncbi:centromere protein L [Phycodurus eques]|uniref:centromere protein L n=1 Tax=Phycodurus eques TaxID=693459 RepID=UPI002ACDC3BE|nr:centromere protein L [Phycodurus eques]
MCFVFRRSSVWIGVADMVPVRKSVERTPNSVVQRSSKSRSYRQSCQSLMAASRLCLTRALTSLRLNTNRRAPKSDNIIDKVNPQHLDSLMKREWQLSYVTPLYRFRYTQLKSYARQLSAFLAAEKQQGLAVEVGGTVCFSVSFSVVQGLVETDDDAEAILIEIYSKPLFTRKDEPLKTVWSGWLACINGNPDYINSLPKEFICLPLFGSSGTEALTALVKSWFQKNFDCCFGLLEISHTSLQWLVALWTNCHTESNVKQLKMIWTLPVKPLLHVTYAVNPVDAWELWSSVRRDPSQEVEEQDNIHLEEVMRLMKGLLSQFYRHFKVDLSAGSLSHVSTALGTAKCSGRIKISNSKCMTTTLMMLTECALLKMPI